MTVVIADSSPLNYLTLIGSVDVLQRLYGTVIVPQQVIAELTDPAARRAPQLLRPRGMIPCLPVVKFGLPV